MTGASSWAGGHSPLRVQLHRGTPAHPGRPSSSERGLCPTWPFQHLSQLAEVGGSHGIFYPQWDAGISPPHRILQGVLTFMFPTSVFLHYHPAVPGGCFAVHRQMLAYYWVVVGSHVLEPKLFWLSLVLFVYCVTWKSYLRCFELYSLAGWAHLFFFSSHVTTIYQKPLGFVCFHHHFMVE